MVTTEHIVIVILAVLLIVERLLHYMAERSWRSERASLYNRLQSGSLADYAAHRSIVEPDKPEPDTVKSTSVPYADLGERSSFDEADLTPTQMAQAQAAADKILGG